MSHASTPPPLGKTVIRLITRPAGIVAAFLIVLVVAQATLDIGERVSRGIAWLTDSGPSENDIGVRLINPPDGRETGIESSFLIPHGTALPEPAEGGYCGPAQEFFAKEGQLVGAAPYVILENNYSGWRGGAVQVERIRVEVVDSSPPRSGIVVECLNSGGDRPAYLSVTARPDSLARTEGEVGAYAFVLDRSEIQFVFLDIEPVDETRSVNLIADFASGERRFSIKLNSDPIVVGSAALSSALRMRPRATGPPFWECVIETSPNAACQLDKAPTTEEADARIRGLP